MRKRTLLIAVIATGGLAGTAEAAKDYSNCTALDKDYRHGVGRPGAKNKTSETPVTNFKRSKRLYRANKESDADGDGIACEKA